MTAAYVDVPRHTITPQHELRDLHDAGVNFTEALFILFIFIFLVIITFIIYLDDHEAPKVFETRMHAQTFEFELSC